MPKLRILSSATSVPPTTLVSPNGTTATHVSSDLFEGDVLVRVKDFKGESADGKERSEPEGEDYFLASERSGKTWSIMVTGRFLEDVDGDDLVFGNIFQHPIRDHLPWGTSLVLKFIHFIDPSMTSDIYGDKPWALSPLLATTPFLSLTPISSTAPLPKWTPASLKPLKEDSRDGLVSNLSRREGNDAAVKELKAQDLSEWDGAKRKSWIGVEANRRKVVLGKEDLVTIDFSQGFLDFNDLSVNIQSIGFHVNLLKYWDGQALTFICRNRSGTKTYFSVAFEIADPDVKPNTTPAGKTDDAKPDAAKESTEEEVSDEVD